MADNLTLRLQEELRRRGTAVDTSTINSILRKNNIDLPTGPPTQTTQSPNVAERERSLWESMGTGSLPDWYEPSKTGSLADGGAINALGAGLWSFADTAAFGIPGAFVDEEEYLDFEDPLAKWTGAIGGFAGFVAGAPMKVGAKVVQKGASAFLRSGLAPTKLAGRGLTDAIKATKKIGLDGGLSRKTVRELNKGYSSLVSKAQIDETLQAGNFAKAVSQYADDYIVMAARKGVPLSGREAAAVREMFAGNALTRPLQDFKGIAHAIYGDTKYARWLGHAINDVAMFSFIDGAMEGVQAGLVDGHKYDFTRPLWGGINGLAFSSLSLLNPKGKGSSFWRDFKVGVQGAFGGKNAYAKMDRNQLARTSRFIGESLGRNGHNLDKGYNAKIREELGEEAGKQGYSTVLFRGKNVNLTSGGKNVIGEQGTLNTLREWERHFPNNTEEAMRAFLTQQRKWFGRKLMKWAKNEELENLMQVWPRMIAGGLLFNTHSFYEMYAHDQDFDFTNDILPHFLIGAYVQRYSNPAKFDLDGHNIKMIRENMHALGMHPEQLTSIPTLKRPVNEFENFFNRQDGKYEKVLEVAEKEGIISDDYNVIGVRLQNTEQSVGLAQNRNAEFESVYNYLNGRRAYTKGLDEISKQSSEAVLEAFKKANPAVDLKNDESFRKMLDVESLKMTEDFEGVFSDVLHSLKGIKFIKDGKEYEFTTKDDLLRVPEMITLSNDLIEVVKKGELEWLKGEDGLAKLKSLEDAFDSLKAITTMAGPNGLGSVKFDKANTVVEVNSAEIARKIYETIVHEEFNIERNFANKSEYIEPFSFANNIHEYAFTIMRNHKIRFSRKAVQIFKSEFQSKQDLQKALYEAGLLEFRDATGESLLVDSIDKVKFTKDENITDAEVEKNAERKRFLGRILTIQSMAGTYKNTDNTMTNIDPAKVDALKKKLAEWGYNEESMPMWLHKHIVDFAIRDKIEKSPDLTLNDVDSILRLSELGMASTSIDVTGKKAAGWKVRLIDEIAFNEGLSTGMQLTDIREYNSRLRDIMDRSNGLITEYKDKVRVTNIDMLREMIDSLPVADISEHPTSARVKVTDFLNLVGTSAIPGSSSFQSQSAVFLADGGPKAQARYVRWLTSHGIMKLAKGTRDWQIDIKKFNEEIQNKMGQSMRFFGVTPAYAERIHETYRKNAKDRESIDSGESDARPLITIQQFFDKYRINGADLSKESAERQTESLDMWIKEDPDMQVSLVDTINNLKNAIEVKAEDGKSWLPVANIRTGRRNKVERDLTQEVTYLIGSRRNQQEVKTVRWNNGKLEYDKETQQRTRFHEYMEGIDVKSYWVVDPTAPTYIMSNDGRTVQRKIMNIFEHNSDNLPEYARKDSRLMQDKFDAELMGVRQVESQDLIGPNGEQGLVRMMLLPNLPPIAVPLAEVGKVVEPFRRFVEAYDVAGSPINTQVLNQMRQLSTDLQSAEASGRKLRNVDYEDAFRYLALEKMVSGNDSSELFIKFLNKEADGGWNWNKLMARGKLFNTKKFIRYDSNFIDDVSKAQLAIGNEQAARFLRLRVAKGGYDVAVWNDKQMADVMKEVDTYVKNNKLNWNRNDILGDAHIDVSSFDSIGYISRELMMELQTQMGASPNSTNPIKPIITSGGTGSALLLGKTLFVHSPELKPFFDRSHSGRKVDILLSASGAKAYNPIMEGGKDVSLINDVVWSGIKNHTIQDHRAIRRISIESLGIKPEKQYDISKEQYPTGKKSHADTNYMTAEEHAWYFMSEIEAPLGRNLDNAISQLSEPIQTREWLLRNLGDGALVGAADGTESTNQLSGIFYFSALTPDANPSSYSKNMVKNKIMDAYINPLINNKRGVTNQFMPETSERYSGQASLVQAPIGFDNNVTRLRPTLVNKDGQMLVRGEVALPSYERNMSFSGLIQKGMQFRLVEDSKVYKMGDKAGETNQIKEIVDKLAGEGQYDSMMKGDFTLGDWHEFISFLGKQNNMPNLQIGIIVRRNPRTRPNDMALMGLKEFMGEEYGTSMMVNSLDVVNVFEGDYDADKADYFFAEKSNMYNHIQRASEFWVQGIDPTRLMGTETFSFAGNQTDKHNFISRYDSNLSLYNKSIGLVQKVPRMLNYLGQLGSAKSLEGTKEEGAKLLYEGRDYKIIMDFDNADFHQRSALETQYIIDGSGTINNEIAQNIRTWRSEFLFPEWESSIVPGEIKNSGGIGFVNDMSRNGNSKGNRVRIFRRLDRDDDGVFRERDNLSTLDKSVIMELMNQYSKVLDVTGDTVYEKSGESRKATYDDAMAATDGFIRFNNHLRKGLYYKLRNRLQDMSFDADGNLINKDKWYKSQEFKELFGVTPHGKGDKMWFTTENNKMFRNTIQDHATGFSNGTRGSQVERVLYKTYEKNLWGDNRVRTLVGDAERYMEDWYTELTSDMQMPYEEAAKQTERFIENIKTVKFDIDHKMDLIKSLKSKIIKIKNNKSMSWAKKQQSFDKLNNLIAEIEGELQGWLSKKYKISKKSKELEKIEFVDLDNKNMRDGTIYYATMDNIKRMMPLINGSDKWGLNESAREDLSQIKYMRKTFYGNQTNLAEMMKYGGKSLLSPEQIKYLEKFPDMNTYNEIETDFIYRSVNKHGIKWLWAFMEPSLNKRKIGIYKGKPVPVPFEASETYDPSSRYRAGLRFLSQIAQGKKVFEDNTGMRFPIPYEESQLAERALSYIQMTQAHFERFFKGKFHMNKLVSENIGESYIFGDESNKRAIYESLRLPNFHKDFEMRFGDFGAIEWNKTGERIRNGFSLVNDHNFDFYREIMKAAGKEGEFDVYIEKMTELQNVMMGTDIINPLEYMDARRTMDKDVKNIAQDVLAKGIGEGGEHATLSKSLKMNPIYALMGGSNFFKGLTLEKPISNMNHLQKVHGLSKRIEGVDLQLKADETSIERIRRLKDDIIEVEKCYGS